MTTTEKRTLLHILLEELSSNGGHFASPDSQLWFDQSFRGFSEDSTETILKEMLSACTHEQ